MSLLKARERNARWRERNPEYYKQYRRKNRERLRQRDQERYKSPDVKARSNAASRKWYATHKEHRKKWEAKRRAAPDYAEMIRDFSLKTKYGMTVDQKREMMARQNNRCAAVSCGHEFKDISDANVDHCHKSGQVRSLLCGRCNRALGLLRENPDLLRELACYVENHDRIPPCKSPVDHSFSAPAPAHR